MTTVPLIVSGIIAKVWCPVCAGSRADIFCLGLTELFFLFSFPHYFCLCEVLMDLYVAQLPFSVWHQMFARITTPAFFFFCHSDRNCLLAVLSIRQCVIVMSQSYTASLCRALFSCVRNFTLMLAREELKSFMIWQTERPLSSHTVGCVSVHFNQEKYLCGYNEEVWGL